MSKLHGIVLTKNEADFIETSLRWNLQYFDHVYVYDNGSHDDTWAIVKELAKEYPQIIPYKSEDTDFRDSLRADVFNHYRERSNHGDWWCRLDSDELYYDNPQEFLSNVRAPNHVVWGLMITYYLTGKDLDQYENPDQGVPPQLVLEDLPKYYVVNGSEPRFFRYRNGLTWDINNNFPTHMGLVYRERIRLKHYQYRSPQQTQVRLNTRAEAERRGCHTFSHSSQKSWREKVFQSEDFHYDRGDGEFVIDNSKVPNHLESVPKRIIKRLAHGLRIWP